MNEASDDDLEESMNSFEAAFSARPIRLPEIAARPIGLALDGSNQDPVARALAGALAAQSEVEIHEVSPPAGGGPPFQKILEECRAARCGLIVVPAPFHEDFAELGAASIGTNLDLLLSRRETPLLVVRDPARDADASLREVVLPLSFVAHDDARAAAWAFHVLAPRGRLHLLAITDPETLARGNPAIAAAIELDEIDESALSGLGQPEMAGLVGAVQRHAAEKDLGCRISIRVGDAVETVTEFANALDDCVLVTDCPRDEKAPAYSRAHALIRQSRHPVLVSGKSAEGGD
jgi:hypothetical protein